MHGTFDRTYVATRKIPVQPDSQYFQLRWRQPNGKVNMKQRLGVPLRQGLKVEKTEDPDDYIMKGPGYGSWTEVDIPKWKLVNQTWAYGSAMHLWENRRENCVNPRMHYRIAHWPYHSAPLGFLQGVDAGTLMYHRMRWTGQYLCGKDRLAMHTSRGKQLRYIPHKIWDLLKNKQLHIQGDPFHLGPDHPCNYYQKLGGEKTRYDMN